MKKKNILKILSGSSLLAISSASLIALGLNNSSQANNTELSNRSNSEYCTVEFKSDEGVVFVGQTKVKVEVGSYFASVKAPTPTHGKMKFDHWSKTSHGAEAIKPNEIITQDITVYPVFQDEMDLSKCVAMSAIENTTITVTHVNTGTTAFAQNLLWSKDYGENWTQVINAETASVDLFPGDTVFFRGNNPQGFNKSSGTDNLYFDISADGAVNMTGSIMGLLDDSTGNITEIPCPNCFEGLFKGNENHYGIKYVSNSFLPATSLDADCYSNMFNGQESLLSAPWLPATTLAAGCYDSMFQDCPLIDFIKISYADVFSPDGENYPFTNNWLDGTSANGTFIYNKENPETQQTGTSAIPAGWTIKKAPSPGYETIIITCDELESGNTIVDNHPYEFKASVPGEEVYQDVTWVSSDTSIASVNPETGVVTGIDEGDVTIYAYSKIDQNVGGKKEIKVRNVNKSDCTTFTATDSTYINWDYGGAGTLPNFKYSWDGENWFDFISGNPIYLDNGDVIYVKGNNPNGLNDGTGDSHARFIFGAGEDELTPKVKIGGKLNALIDDGRFYIKDIPCDFCFNSLFMQNGGLASVAPDFLAHFDNLSLGCYQKMFQYCINLDVVDQKEIQLPNNNLAGQCYLYMFRGCVALTKASTLPATTLAEHCYKAMYYGCFSLTETPELKAETATVQCYYEMFCGCWGLTKIGKIHLKTLERQSCYYMFENVSDTLFNKDGTGTAFFTCPSTDGVTEPVVEMFSWTVGQKIQPKTGEVWYFNA